MRGLVAVPLLLAAVTVASQAKGILHYQTRNDGNLLVGRYYRPDLDLGLRFRAGRGSLILLTWGGEPMILLGQKMNNETCRIVQLGSKQFLQFRHLSQKAIYGVRPDRKLYTSDLQRGRAMESTVDKNETKDMFEEVVERLLQMPETKLIEEIAISLGEKGITGERVPASLALYGVAMRIVKVFKQQESDEGSQSEDAGHSLEKRGWLDSVIKAIKGCSRDPVGSECLGLCGKDCTCWPWVCGDCCYHEGCYQHDLCCTRDFFDSDCLIPWGFSCSSYSC